MHLGISNIYQPSLLRKMIDFATVPVDIVQNRWWEGNGWDWESESPRPRDLGSLSHDVSGHSSPGYLQGARHPLSVCLRASRNLRNDQCLLPYHRSFWTLSGNPALLKSPPILQLSKTHNLTPQQVLFKFCQR